MKKNEIEERIEQAMQSLDGIQRVAPKPFLLTRIQSALSRQASVTDKWYNRTAAFISRPSVALAGIVLILGINIAMITIHKKTQKPLANEQSVSDSRDEYAMNVSAFYDFENQEP